MGKRPTSETSGLSYATWTVTMPESYDNINPSHYRGDRKFEPIDVIEDWNLNYRLGNALKYISRSGRKPGEDPVEGLKKAIWYLQREIDSYELKPDFEDTQGYDRDDRFYDEIVKYEDYVGQSEWTVLGDK